MDEKWDFAPCGYVALTAQGILKEINHTFLEMTGYRREELYETYFESLLSAASKIMFHSLFFPQIRMNGKIEELYLTLMPKCGDNIQVLLMGNKNPKEQEEIIHCVIIRTSRRDDYEEELQHVKHQLEDAYRTENKLRLLFETTLISINEGLIVTDTTGMITIINDLAQTYTACPKETALNKFFEDIFCCSDDETHANCASIISHILIEKMPKYDFNELILTAWNQTRRYVSGTAAAITAPDGTILGVVVSFKDITKEYLQEKEFDSFLNVNMEMLCVVDEHGNFHKINRKFEETLGYTIEDIAGKQFLSFVHIKDLSDTANVISESIECNELSVFTNRYQCKDGSYKYIEWYRLPVTGKYAYASARDVTEKMQKEKQLLKIAEKDQLTGLYNRHFLTAYLADTLENAAAKSQAVTMAILDLDNFKIVNDTWGHPIGDEQLKLTAKTVLHNIRKRDLLVRFGGEEFVIILPATPLSEAVGVLEQIRCAIEQNRHPVTGRQTISIGATEWHDPESFEDWYTRVDKALYLAKEGGRNQVYTLS